MAFNSEIEDQFKETQPTPYRLYLGQVIQEMQDFGLDFHFSYDESMDLDCMASKMLGVVVVKQGFVATLWRMSYLYRLVYHSYFENTKPMTSKVFVDTKSALWKHIESIRSTVLNSSLVEPNNQQYLNGWEYTNYVCKYALLYCLLHEYSHLIYQGSANSTQIDEESFCDKNAFDLFWQMNATRKGGNDRDHENILKYGIQLAFIAMNVRSIDSNYFDGIVHPKTYDRIKIVLGDICRHDDHFWCFLTAALTLEMHFLKIEISHDKIYDDFKSVIKYFISLLRNYDRQKNKH